MSSNFSTLDLRNVMPCAADSIHPAFAARALENSAARCDFADAILFTHATVPTSVRTVLIPRLQSKEDYSAFMVKQLLDCAPQLAARGAQPDHETDPPSPGGSVS